MISKRFSDTIESLSSLINNTVDKFKSYFVEEERFTFEDISLSPGATLDDFEKFFTDEELSKFFVDNFEKTGGEGNRRNYVMVKDQHNLMKHLKRDTLVMYKQTRIRSVAHDMSKRANTTDPLGAIEFGLLFNIKEASKASSSK